MGCFIRIPGDKPGTWRVIDTSDPSIYGTRSREEENREGRGFADEED